MVNLQYYIETFGCQMNVADSELVAGMLQECGYSETEDLNQADILFMNTCAIREKAEETVHNRLDSIQHLKKRNPQMLIGVLGCMAQNLKDDLLETKPYVDIILGPDSYRRIPEIIKSRNGENNHEVDTRLSKYEVYEDLLPSRYKGVNAWVSISRGCDKFCTFCIVPFTRGRERSRSFESIIDEVEDAARGLLEPERKIIVTGHANVLEVFKHGRREQIAGVRVSDGVLKRSGRMRVIRDQKEIFDGAITSMRHLKENVRELVNNFEGGVMVDGFHEYEEGDQLEGYEVQVTRR